MADGFGRDDWPAKIHGLHQCFGPVPNLGSDTVGSTPADETDLAYITGPLRDDPGGGATILWSGMGHEPYRAS